MDQCITHVCKRCGQEFVLEPPAYKRTWCRPCKREYMRQYNASYTPPQSSIAAVCKTCGIDFIGKNRYQKYCSEQCRNYCPDCDLNRSHGLKRYCEVHNKSTQRKCLWCATNFSSNGPRRYCGDKCKSASKHLLKKLKQPQFSICGWCFTTFPYRLNNICCSTKCRAAQAQNLKTHRAPDRCHLPVCRTCRMVHGASPEAFARRGQQCPDCAKRLHQSKERATNTKRLAKERRRALAVSDGDNIDVVVLAEMFDWVCHLCDEPINSQFKWPHPGAATVDHVIPITPFALGDEPGTHTWDNVRPAHAQCNSKRGNRPIAS